MKENFIKQVLSTDFYSPMFWESISINTINYDEHTRKYKMKTIVISIIVFDSSVEPFSLSGLS